MGPWISSLSGVMFCLLSSASEIITRTSLTYGFDEEYILESPSHCSHLLYPPEVCWGLQKTNQICCTLKQSLDCVILAPKIKIWNRIGSNWVPWPNVLQLQVGLSRPNWQKAMTGTARAVLVIMSWVRSLRIGCFAGLYHSQYICKWLFSCL